MVTFLDPWQDARTCLVLVIVLNPLSPTPTQVHTCPPAMGYSFAAGTIDGPGAFDFTQGTEITGTPVTGDTSAVLHY